MVLERNKGKIVIKCPQLKTYCNVFHPGASVSTPGCLKLTLKTGVLSLCCARTRLQCEAFLEEFSAVVSQNFPTESCRRADSR